MACLIGVHVGIPGVRTILVNERGKALAISHQSYPPPSSQRSWMEQDPQDWWSATVDSIKEVLHKAKVDASEIQGVGLSGPTQTLVLVDERGDPVHPAMLETEAQTAEFTSQILTALDAEMSSTDDSGSLSRYALLAQLLWMRKHAPELLERAHRWLLPKDYVRYQLTGEIATDVSDAASTGLLDIEQRAWAPSILRHLELSESLLPSCYESTEICGKIHPSAAEATGLLAGTPVVCGATEAVCHAVAHGVIHAGQVLASLKDAGGMLVCTETAAVDPQRRVTTLCHVIPDRWCVMGGLPSAGSAFRWFRDALADAEVAEAKSRGVSAYELLTAQATESPVGSEGLLFLPFLEGGHPLQRSLNARGGYLGLTLRHSKAHVIRATMEGITYAMRDAIEIFHELHLPLERVCAVGGGSRSSLWRQMQADIFNVEVVTTDAPDTPAFGAALLAAVGIGLYTTVEEATDAWVRIASTNAPDPKNAACYEAYYQVYRTLFSALEPQFEAVARLTVQSSE